MLAVNEIRIHSRKQLITWVQSTGVYKFDELKNGLFFIKLLTILVPQDSSKNKIYDKPNNIYEYTYNMNTVKRILNKHNLQMNMDVPGLVNSKNCFQFANWFKNLYDQNRGDKEDEFVYAEKNFTPSKTNSSFKYNSPVLKNILRATSSDATCRSDKSKSMKKNQMFKQLDKSDKSMILFYKPGKNMSALNIQDKNYKMKTMISNQKFISPIKKVSQSQYLQGKQLKNIQPLDFDDHETALSDLLKIQALKQSIQSYENILERVKKIVNSGEDAQLAEFKKSIIDTIYMRK